MYVCICIGMYAKWADVREQIYSQFSPEDPIGHQALALSGSNNFTYRTTLSPAYIF